MLILKSLLNLQKLRVSGLFVNESFQNLTKLFTYLQK
jgi:hypothetical protein